MGPFVQSQRDAWKNLDMLMADPRLIFLPEPSALEAAFRAFTQAATPSHAGWTDAYLAAFAVGHRVRVVTFDQGFSQFNGLDCDVLS